MPYAVLLVLLSSANASEAWTPMLASAVTRAITAAEAKMELSTTGIDAQLQDIERDAASIEVDDTLAAYKREMGLVRESAPVTMGSDSRAGEKTLGPAEKSKALE